ncbi:acetylesterase [Nostoc sp. 3335mG]|nr:acetylesterase [Nostoc sp. 3335mG]
MNRPTLDPEIAEFVRAMQDSWASHPPFTTLTPPEARAVAEAVREPWRRGGPDMARTIERQVPTSTGALRIRVYDPGIAKPAPALIYMHGGGFVLFSIDTHDRLMREYAAAGDMLVIGVDYPLSPEARYPTALDQIVALVDWLRSEDGEGLGVDPSRIALGGDSAGGNLALTTALKLRDRGDGAAIAALLLNYGAFGAPCSDEAEARFGGAGAVLDRAEMEYYFDAYARDPGHALDDPYARPIIADLRDLPPAFLVVPECDILAEQSHAMAARMREAGVDVTSKVYPGATHSFLEAMSVAAVAREAIADGAAFVKASLMR